MSMYSHQTRHGLGNDPMRVPGAWWCPDCNLLVTAPRNPILCDNCDGDMTIAPERFQPKTGPNPRSKEAAP